MRRFELVEGTSNKFWQVTLRGADLEVAWGRVGTQGQTKTKTFPSASDAQSEQERAIREKTKKGYVEAAHQPVPAHDFPSLRRSPKNEVSSTKSPAERAESHSVNWTDTLLSALTRRRGGAGDREPAWPAADALFETVGAAFAQVTTAAEGRATSLARFVGLETATGKVLGLEHRAWRKGPPQDSGLVWWLERPLPNELRARLTLTPGLFPGAVTDTPPQTLGEVEVYRGKAKRVALGEVDAIAFSELVRELEALR